MPWLATMLTSVMSPLRTEPPLVTLITDIARMAAPTAMGIVKLLAGTPVPT